MTDVYHCPWCGEVPAAYDPPGWHQPDGCGSTLAAKLHELNAALGEFAEVFARSATALIRRVAEAWDRDTTGEDTDGST